MVRVGYQTSYDSQDCEWINLHVRMRLTYILFVECDKSVVFFIDIEVLNDAFSQEI